MGKSKVKINAKEKFRMNRKEFFRLLGGGIFIFVHPWNSSGRDTPTHPAPAPKVPTDFNAFLHINENGKVTGFTGKIDMGQGNRVPIMQLLADELCVEFENVDLVMGDTALCPWDSGTSGSTSIRKFGLAMRKAAAEAREVLVQLASEEMGIPPEKLETVKGTVREIKNPRKLIRYEEISKGKQIERHITDEPVLLDHKKFNTIGISLPRLGLVNKVTGKALFTGDLKIPGMVHARILRPPSHNAKLVHADTSAAEEISGVQIIQEGDLVAILHENRDTADVAITKVKAEYSFSEEEVNEQTIFDWMHHAKAERIPLSSKGTLAEGMRKSKETFQHEYHNSYVAHAPIETHTALANPEGDKMTVWASTQSPFYLQADIAKVVDYPIENIRVIVPFVGGAFGGKNYNQQALEAALLAKLSGKPVMLAWTREEEFFLDKFRPAGLVTINSGIDDQGKITFWDFNTYFNYPRGTEVLYDVPDFEVSYYNVEKGQSPKQPLAVGSWRAPGCNTHTHAIESQIDIMASKAGMDPLEFRLKNMKDQKMINVLTAVAEKFGYEPARTPGGRGIGMACAIDVNTWAAVMVQLSVDEQSGEINVERVVCAMDAGLVVNPLGTVLQIESCAIMGISYALFEEISFEGGKIFTQNFDSYKITPFSSIPKIESVLLDKKGSAFRGCW